MVANCTKRTHWVCYGTDGYVLFFFFFLAHAVFFFLCVFLVFRLFFHLVMLLTYTYSNLVILCLHISMSWGEFESGAPAPVVAAPKTVAAPAQDDTKSNKKQQNQNQNKQKQQQKQKQKQKQKQNNKGKKGGKGKQQAAAPEVHPITQLEFKVGKVVHAEKHAEADKLYIEKIDLGEGEPRLICSGLVPYMSVEELSGARLIVVSNLKPTKMVGVMSNGMVLCASNADHTVTKLVLPPAEAKIGERIIVQGLEDDFKNAPEPQQVNAKKKKNNVWKDLAPLLRTNADGVACFDGKPLVTSAGALTAELSDAAIA
jgi:aminoacyl tRNA synthase complex-interacting multifunctional protein 1